MKKLFLVTAGIIFCFLMSCKESTSTGTESTQAEKNKSNSKEVNRAIETGDVSKLDSFMAKDIVDHSGPNGDIKGIDSIKSLFLQIHNHVDNIKIESIANATDGDYDFDLNRFTGTTNSAFMGMPPNTKIDMRSVDVVKIKDGKAVEHWGFVDPKDMMKMMPNNMNMGDTMRTGMGNKMGEKMDTSKKNYK